MEDLKSGKSRLGFLFPRETQRQCAIRGVFGEVVLRGNALLSSAVGEILIFHLSESPERSVNSSAAISSQAEKKLGFSFAPLVCLKLVAAASVLHLNVARQEWGNE